MNDPTLDKIVSVIVRAVHPNKIILFGSRARGDALDDSDWDVALFIDGFDESREGDDLGFLAGRYWLRGMMVSPVGLPADRRDVAAGLLANIDRDGIAL